MHWDAVVWVNLGRVAEGKCLFDDLLATEIRGRDHFLTHMTTAKKNREFFSEEVLTHRI